MRIGVISDTHNYLDPKVPAIFKGVDHILHGGDIGLPWVLLELEQIAPVTAVLGNCDDSGLNYKETEALELDGRKVLIHHIVDPARLADELQRRIIRDGTDLVIFGHTHKPHWSRENGVHFLNPGYAGKQRFDLERSVAILCMNNGVMEPEFISLKEA